MTSCARDAGQQGIRLPQSGACLLPIQGSTASCIEAVGFAWTSLDLDCGDEFPLHRCNRCIAADQCESGKNKGHFEYACPRMRDEPMQLAIDSTVVLLGNSTQIAVQE